MLLFFVFPPWTTSLDAENEGMLYKRMKLIPLCHCSRCDVGSCIGVLCPETGWIVAWRGTLLKTPQTLPRFKNYALCVTKASSRALQNAAAAVGQQGY